MSSTLLPKAKSNPFFKLVKRASNVCAAALKNGSKIGAKLSGNEPEKDFFSSSDYQSWISTRLAQVKNTGQVTGKRSLEVYAQVELAALERQQSDPAAAYETRKKNLVKYADALRNLAKENFLDDIALIWHALAKNNTKPGEQFLHSLLKKSGPTAGKGAFLLGQICEGRFDYREALKFYRRAYLYGPKNRNYIEANAHIAFLLEYFDEAEALLINEISFLRASRRKHSGKLYNAIKNLAHIYESQGNLEAALAQHQQALTVRESVLGSDHPEIAAALNNIATLCEVRGHLDEAHQYISRALKIYEATFGPESPKVAASLSNLASIYQKKNQLEDAEETYKQGLAIALKSVGPENPLYRKIKFNLEGLQAAL